MFKNWFLLVSKVSGRKSPSNGAIIWVLASSFVIIGAASLVANVSIDDGIFSGSLSEEIPLSSEVFASLFTIVFVCLLLVSIQFISDKNERIKNATIDELFKIFALNRVALYAAGFAVKLAGLAVLAAITFAGLYIFLLLFFQLNAYIIFRASWIIIYISILLIVLFDFFFLITKNSGRANTYTTLTLVFSLIITSVLNPMIEIYEISYVLSFLINAILPDLFTLSYIAGQSIVPIYTPILEIVSSLFLVIVLFICNSLLYKWD